MTRRHLTPRPGQPVRGSSTGRPIMALLDLLGRRAALTIIWVLRDGRPATFRTLQASAGGIAAATLNSRLRELREAGLITRATSGYVLTPDGHELLAASTPLMDWVTLWAQRLEADQLRDGSSVRAEDSTPRAQPGSMRKIGET